MWPLMSSGLSTANATVKSVSHDPGDLGVIDYAVSFFSFNAFRFHLAFHSKSCMSVGYAVVTLHWLLPSFHFCHA